MAKVSGDNLQPTLHPVFRPSNGPTTGQVWPKGGKQ